MEEQSGGGGMRSTSTFFIEERSIVNLMSMGSFLLLAPAVPAVRRMGW